MDSKLTKSLSSKQSAVKLGIFIAIIAAMLIATASTPAQAEVTRGCEGTFVMDIVNGTGIDTSKERKKALDKFEGRGACKNSNYGNTCRKRAMDKIFRCANDIWDNRWNLIGDPNDNNPDMILPAICRGDTTGARQVGFRTNPHGKGTDIKYSMEFHACCTMQPTSDSLQLKLTVFSSGDKGCGKNYNNLSKRYWESRTLIDNYMVNCQSLIQQGMCAKRTGG